MTATITTLSLSTTANFGFVSPGGAPQGRRQQHLAPATLGTEVRRVEGRAVRGRCVGGGGWGAHWSTSRWMEVTNVLHWSFSAIKLTSFGNQFPK